MIFDTKDSARRYFSEISFIPKVSQYFLMIQNLTELIKSHNVSWGSFKPIINKLFKHEPDLIFIENVFGKGFFSYPQVIGDQINYFDQQGNGVRPEALMIPGLSFDKRGFRLGRGKGHFDKYFATQKPLRIGVCFHEFLSDKIPDEGHDVKMDFIVTDKCVIEIGN